MAAEDRHLHCIGVRRLIKGIQTASGRSFRSYRRGDGEKSDQESSQRSLRIAACAGRPRRCGQEEGGGVRAPRPVAIWIWWWSWCGRFQPATEFYHRDTGDTEFSLFLLDVVRYPPGRPSPAPPQHGRGVETGGEGSGGRRRLVRGTPSRITVSPESRQFVWRRMPWRPRDAVRGTRFVQLTEISSALAKLPSHLHSSRDNSPL